MPIIKSAKKRMRQNAVRRARNFTMRSKLRTHIKKALLLIKEGKEKEATAAVSVAYSMIDTACKKNILHKNTADRRKSTLARALNNIGEASKKAEKKKKAPAKKVEAKKEEAQEAAKTEEKK